MTRSHGITLENILLGLKIRGELEPKVNSAREAAERLARKIQAAREALCKPSDVMPTESQSAPSVLVGGSDPYGCDFETDGRDLPLNKLDIEHLTGAMDSSGRFAVRSTSGDHGVLTPQSAKERGYAPLFSYAVQTTHGELSFESGSLAYHHITTLIANKIRDTYYPESDYGHEGRHAPPAFVLMVLDKLTTMLHNCEDMIKEEDVAIPEGFFNHLLYLTDEAEKLEHNIRLFTSGASSGYHGRRYARSPNVEEVVETPILTEVAPEVAPSSQKMEEAGPSDVPKQSFATVAALKKATIPEPVPKPAPKPVKVEIHVTEKTEESKAPSDNKTLAKPAVKEVKVDREGYQAPKKPAPKMEMTAHKVLPIGTSSSSSSSESSHSDRSPKPDNSQPSAFTDSGDKIVLNLTEEENAQLMAKVRRDQTKKKLRQKVAKREAARKAAEEADKEAEAELKEKLMNDLIGYKQHLKSGRLHLRSQFKELNAIDPDKYTELLSELPPFDQSVLLAFEDKPRPNNSKTIISKFIGERLEVWIAKKDVSMIRYWSVLASDFNVSIIDDLLYIRRLAFIYKVSNAEKERYDRVYMRIAFEGDRESRVEASIDCLLTDDPLIDVEKVKQYLQRRAPLVKSKRVLSDEELGQIPVIEHVLYTLPVIELVLYKMKNGSIPIDPSNMTEVYIQWRKLCVEHPNKHINQWASAFNFMARNPHFVFSNDIRALLEINELTESDEAECADWKEEFLKGDIKGPLFLSYVDDYMKNVFGINASAKANP